MLVKSGLTVWAQVMMYQTVVHTVFLYRRKSWVVTDEMLKVLEGLHHRFDWRVSGMKYYCVREGGYEWSL